MSNIEILNRGADNIRILSAAMVEKANSGHPGGAMGGADFINILYSKFLNFDPDDSRWINRDRFYLDPGHMSPMLYSVLAFTGQLKTDDLKNFRQWGSVTPGHPEADLAHAIENTSGPLGQGHVMAVGAAIAERFLTARFGELFAHKIYTFISDGGIQEEISQGAGRIAGHLGLSNLIMFYDSNDIQLSSFTSDVTNEDTAKKYEAWGWNVITIDGNNAFEISEALLKAGRETQRPTLIIGKTVMGKGALTESGDSFERQYSTHGQPISKAGASFEETVKNLGGDPENPFVIFDDVAEFYAEVLEQKRRYVAERRKEQEKWEKKNPALAAKLHSFYNNEIPAVNYQAIEQKPGVATRAASGAVLAHLAGAVENMIVSSADLSNSDKTDSFLKNTTIFRKGDFSGNFLQAGVSEFTMAAIANGMALHGGVIPAVATFFVFSDYIKPAARMAALMQLPVKYIYTHDSFRVGEDGPTHQPIEQEAQLRLMEELHNHSGKRSMLVLRPADAAETTVAWKMAMENLGSPTALILSRQNIKALPAKANSSRFADALDAQLGAYIVCEPEGEADIILLANGSEVSTLYEASLIIAEEGIRARVVSAISEGLFNDQDDDYRNMVLPAHIPVFGLTAGLPSTLSGFMKGRHKIKGMTAFGYSAPAAVLDEKFGFKPESVAAEIMEFLK
jgi:transketolase